MLKLVVAICSGTVLINECLHLNVWISNDLLTKITAKKINKIKQMKRNSRHYKQNKINNKI